MRILNISRIALAVLVAGFGIWSVPSGAQQFKPKVFTPEIQKQYVRETESGAYKVSIKWRLVKGGKDLQVVNVAEIPSGKVQIFRDRSKALNIKSRMISPNTLEFRFNDLPLMVKVAHPPFAIVGTGVDVVGGQGTNGQLVETRSRVYPKASDQTMVVFDSVVTQTIPRAKGAKQGAGDEEGETTVTYVCETCPSNPCSLGLD